MFTYTGSWGRPHRAFVVLRLTDWENRERSHRDIVRAMIPNMSEITAARGFPITPAGLGLRGSRTPLRIVVSGPDFESVKEWAGLLLARGQQNPNLLNLEMDYEENQPQLDISLDRLRWFDNTFQGRVKTLYSSAHNLEVALGTADLVVGAVLVAGAKAPNLVTRSHLSLMQPGSAIVDVAVDQGGCVETTHPTTHADPIYVVDGIVHYAVANMPGAVARTSTFALNNATMRQGVMIANMGWEAAIAADPTLRPGVNVANGKVTYEAVAKAHGLEYHPLP